MFAAWFSGAGSLMGERQGILFLVVGPSGVGKDSLIDGARRRLADDAGYHFPVRSITRPEDAMGEDHQAVTVAGFECLEAAGNFMLSWQAHGHRYGIPKTAEQALEDGRSVVVNVSRQLLDQARRRWPAVRIVLVSAPREVLRARLVTRGRETAQEVQKRLDRAGSYEVVGDDVREVVNADRLEHAVERFMAVLEAERHDMAKVR
ncbi:MAG: phosphonate metabolism protein/1,5-bisphosphokinase (PRPP-forming) PhnN [Geminicoccaceae bacterium]